MPRGLSFAPLRPAMVRPPATSGVVRLGTLMVATVVFAALYLERKVFVPRLGATWPSCYYRQQPAPPQLDCLVIDCVRKFLQLSA